MFRKPDETGKHHARLSHVVKAADDGCKICLAIHSWFQLGGDVSMDGVLEEEQLDYRFSDEDSVIWVQDGTRIAELCLQPSPHITPTDEYLGFLLSAAEDLAESPWHVRKDPFYKHIPCSTAHRQITQQSSHWLNTCLASHPECEFYGPTRNPT